MPTSNERDLFENFKKQEGLKKIRSAMDDVLGHPVWWVGHKIGKGPKSTRQCFESSLEIWKDARLKQRGAAQNLFKALRSKPAKEHSYALESRLLGKAHVFPLVSSERHPVAFVALTGLPTYPSESPLKILSEYLQLLLESVSKSEELARLSATIRPRAVALSTVHTVHRIINSTLNLEELVSRLAHLTAQVLRVHRCAIHLLEPSSKTNRTPVLVCKTRVGFSGSARKKVRLGSAGKMENRVVKFADIQLRKKVLCIPLIDEDVIGVVTVSGKKDKTDFTHFDLEILTTLAEEAVIAIKNAQLYEEQRRVTLGTIQSLAVVLGSRVAIKSTISPEAFAQLAIRTAQELKLNEDQIQALHYAALLKETTKIGIPEEILKKPSKLTGEELSTLKTHTIQGAKIVQNFENLRTVAPIILYSREKYDGSGYPEGLKGEAIPIGARILSVINAFEAIIEGRPYRGKSTRVDAIQELEKNRVTQFDPNVVDAFVRVVRKESLAKRFSNAGAAQ